MSGAIIPATGAIHSTDHLHNLVVKCEKSADISRARAEYAALIKSRLHSALEVSVMRVEGVLGAIGSKLASTRQTTSRLSLIFGKSALKRLAAQRDGLAVLSAQLALLSALSGSDAVPESEQLDSAISLRTDAKLVQEARRFNHWGLCTSVPAHVVAIITLRLSVLTVRAGL